ncbi:hypothetical protein H4W34_003352 [Actinomadura algeriensis]|uniref:Uncharacterized protein n=2 Tax=Actinomadura algeriensis TaxID=1679523 RepID=A0ABR9JSZ6_9ACTN|nr:hypothetical protein [Actinomadura algeriensis]
MADINFFVVEKANVGHNGPVYVVEEGPGDLSYSNVTGSPKASPKVGNESVKTGDFKTSLHGGKGNTAVNEVEGSEQDQIKPGHGKKDSGKHEAAAAEGKQAEGQEAEGKEAEAVKAEGQQAEAHQAEGKQAEGQEAEGKQAEGQEAEGKQAEGKQAEGQEAEGKQAEAVKAEGQEAEGKQAEAVKAEGKQAEGKEAHARQGQKPHGHDKGKLPKNVYGVKHGNVGNNGPTVVVESGPGDLNYSNVTGSDKAMPVVGNEAVKTGDIKTSIRDGKNNTAVTEVEGAEQDEGEK